MILLIAPPSCCLAVKSHLLSGSKGRVCDLSKCRSSSIRLLKPTKTDDQIPLLRRPPLPNNTTPTQVPILPNPLQNNITQQTDTKPTHPNTKQKVTATDILHLMDSLQLSIPTDTYASLLKECIDSRDAASGAVLHAHISRSNQEPSLLLLNRLLIMYVACGHLDDARQLFEKMPVKDSISWATMIAGYVDNQHYGTALLMFDRMCQSELLTTLTIPSVLKACSNTGDFRLGKQLHGWVVKNMNCNTITTKDTVEVWNSVIIMYCKESSFNEVIKLFKEMGREGIKMNSFTYLSVLRACGRIKDEGRRGKQVHACVVKHGGMESNVFVQTSLVDMYAKCGLLEDARKVFERISREKRTGACWNAMLTGYTQHGCSNEAIQFLYQMRAAGFEPSESMLKQVRMACVFGET